VLALLITTLTAVYLLGPGLIARWILGLFVSPRVTVRSRSEELTRALLLSIVPLAAAIAEATLRRVLQWRRHSMELKTFFSSIYSDSSFREHERIGDFYHAASTFLWMNGSILWRLYAIVLPVALGFALVAWQYGKIVRWQWIQKRNWLTEFVAWMIRDHISEWHLHLSSFSLGNKAATLQADVLTVSGTLYQGALKSAIRASDGQLAGLVLSNPRRFDREPYLRRKEALQKPDANDFWKDIPSETFVISGPDISTINVREVLPTDADFVGDIEELLDSSS